MPIGRPKVYAIIPAAGSGTRLGGSIRKQFVDLDDRPILAHTILRFEQCIDVDEIVLAVPEQCIVETKSLVSRYRLHKVGKIIAGAEVRQGSVWNAVRKLNLGKNDIVLVHDGVRPFIEVSQINEIIQACREFDSAALAIQPKDTVRRSNSGLFYDQTIDRAALWLMQTPQGFRAPILKKALESAVKENFIGTDEVSLVERIGIKPRIIKGSYDNIKITTPEDLELGSLILHRMRKRGKC